MALVLLLADGTEIEIADATYNKHYVVNCSDSADFVAKRTLFTPSNLSDIKIYDDDVEVAHIVGLELSGAQEVINPDETVTGHFYFYGGQNVTADYAEVGRILIGDGEQ